MAPIPAFDLLYFYGQVLASQPDSPSPSSEHSLWIIYVGISLTCLTTRFGPETCKRRAPSVVKLHCMCSTQYSAWSPREKPQPQTCKRVCVWGGCRGVGGRRFMVSPGFLLSLPCSTIEPSDPLVVQAKVALGSHNSTTIALDWGEMG